MGAYEFSTVALGKTPEEAFRMAVEDARYEHGHGGYTGTIAEKQDFILIVLPPRVTPQRFHQLLQEFMELKGNAEWLSGERAYAGNEDRDLVRQSQQADAKLTRFRSKQPLQLLACLERGYQLFNDKWGPALAYEITGKAASETKKRLGRAGTHDRVFCFCGLASS